MSIKRNKLKRIFRRSAGVVITSCAALVGTQAMAAPQADATADDSQNIIQALDSHGVHFNLVGGTMYFTNTYGLMPNRSQTDVFLSALVNVDLDTLIGLPDAQLDIA